MKNSNQIHNDFHVVIMAGGSGTRFWPESTQEKPKQYLTFGSDKTLMERTLSRFLGVVPQKNLHVVTLKDQKELALKYSGSYLTEDSLILEPLARNTAPCILLSIASLLNNGASIEDKIGFFAADHLIQDERKFEEILQNSISFLNKNEKIVTLGIEPTFPHTGFGYIESHDEIENGFFNVGGFREKPKLELAKDYLQKGNYLWNAGMFIASIKTLLSEFEIHTKELYQSFLKMKDCLKTGDLKGLEAVYKDVKGISVDFAVMEKTKKVCVTRANMGWNDVGSWDALEEILPKTNHNVFAQSSGKSYIENAKGNIIFSSPKKMVSLIDVNDLIVIENEKSIVIMPKTSSQKVKNVVEYLKTKDFGKDYL